MFTRAVSLEVVNDATAGMFINSFTRFISRRGCPNTVITDKGSVFTAAETQTFMSNRLVNWKFTLDGAPWQGGVWERLVGSVKRCNKKVVGVRTLSYVELQTIVAEVENILNNRPIGADYEDDFEDIITPNHLIVGRRLDVSSDGRDIDIRDEDSSSVKRRKRYIDTILDHFWQRWRLEYLASLREIERRTNPGHSSMVQLKDIVIVHDEKVPRHMWRVGRVVKLISGSDNQIRGAEVKLGRTGAVIRRPVNKLYPLLTNTDVVDNTPFTMSQKSAASDSSRNVQRNVASNNMEIQTYRAQSDTDLDTTPVEIRKRPKRKAALAGEARRKFECN